MKHPGLVALILTLILSACGPQPPPVPSIPPATPTATVIPTSTPLPEPTIAPTPVANVLYVEPATDLGLISPYIYGSNYGPASAIPADQLQTAYDAGFTTLRWPGGAWGDRNDVKPYQLDQFMTFCKQMGGALPTISVRLRQGTPEAAAELVRYANIEKKYGIVYWSIGNEPTLYEAELSETYDTVRLNKEWRAIAEAMKAVDPSIKLMGPELHQWGIDLQSTPKDSAGRDWMTEFLKANGDLVAIVSVHRYPLWTSGRAVTIEEMRQNTREWTQMVTYLRALIQELTGHDLPIAFTEVNSSPTNASGGEASPDSFYNAIWYADVIGHLAQQRIFMVNNWIISGRTGGLGLFSGSNIRPTFYVFPLYKQFGSELVYSASGVEDVNIYAAKRADGTLTLMVINLTDSEQKVPLQVHGQPLTKAEIWRLDKDNNAANLGIQDFPADGVLTLPIQSATLYVLGK